MGKRIMYQLVGWQVTEAGAESALGKDESPETNKQSKF